MCARCLPYGKSGGLLPAILGGFPWTFLLVVLSTWGTRREADFPFDRYRFVEYTARIIEHVFDCLGLIPPEMGGFGGGSDGLSVYP